MKVIRLFYKVNFEGEDPRTKSIIGIRLKSTDSQFIRLWTHKGEMQFNKNNVTRMLACPKRFTGDLPPEEEVLQ